MTPLDHSARAASLLQSKPVLVHKLEAACEVDAAGALAGLTEVLRFLDLCADAGRALTPSPRVDDAWHEFVLCTRQYAAYCDRHFGRFVHHDPGGSDEDNRRQFRETLHAYGKRFGQPDVAWWGKAAEQIPTADCGGCQSP